MRYRLAALAIVGVCGTASAAEIVDSQFQVEVTRDGKTVASAEPVVPFLPGEACYYWFVQLAAGDPGEVPIVERLALPAPATAWNPEDGDTTTKIVVDAGGRGVTSSFPAKPDEDGWINGGWCLGEGDPLGAYQITVDAGGQQAGNWRFTVVPAEDGPAPAVEDPAPMQPAPPARTVPDTPTARG